MTAQVVQIFEANSTDLQVIRLSLEDNEVKVYYCEQHTLEQIDDLLHLILERRT